MLKKLKHKEKEIKDIIDNLYNNFYEFTDTELKSQSARLLGVVSRNFLSKKVIQKQMQDLTNKRLGIGFASNIKKNK